MWPHAPNLPRMNMAPGPLWPDSAVLIISLRISASTFESASDQSRNHCWNCCCREGHPPQPTHLSHAKAMQAQALHLRGIRRPVRPASRVRLLLRHKTRHRIGIIRRKKQLKSSVGQTWQRLSVNRRLQQGNQARQAVLGMSVTPKAYPAAVAAYANLLFTRALPCMLCYTCECALLLQSNSYGCYDKLLDYAAGLLNSKRWTFESCMCSPCRCTASFTKCSIN